MKIIGLTGNIASGKSTVENIIRQQGFCVVDADNICHEILQNDNNVIEQIKILFADFDILNKDNTLNRNNIGEIVFSDSVLKNKLEKIIHPVVLKEINEFINNNRNEKVIFISVPLLFEARMENIFDKIILVSAKEEIRLKRLIKRNNYTVEHAGKRINSQIKEELKRNLSDYIIENNSSFESLEKNTKKILEKLI